MEIGSVVSSGGALARDYIAGQVDGRMRYTAMNSNNQAAAALIQAVPEPAPAANPPNLGNAVDAYA